MTTITISDNPPDWIKDRAQSGKWNDLRKVARDLPIGKWATVPCVTPGEARRAQSTLHNLTAESGSTFRFETHIKESTLCLHKVNA